jgi:integrase/recombinase XerD
MNKRTSASKKALELAKYLQKENPDYNYLKDVFRHLRKVLDVKVVVEAKTKVRETYIPTEIEIKKYYEAVWKSQDMQNMIILKTLLYTGIRVSELVRIKLEDVDLNNEKIAIVSTKEGGTNRIVPIPKAFKEILAMHISSSKKKGAKHLFESSWKKQYTDRAIRKISAQYSKEAGIKVSISPNTLRNFLFTWMKKNEVEDALLQPYSGHKHTDSLERFRKLASFVEVKEKYEKIIRKFPV